MRSWDSILDDIFFGDWKVFVFCQICDILGEILQVVVYMMVDKFMFLDRCFEFFVVDFLVDMNVNVWLLEVNEMLVFYQYGVVGLFLK